MDQGLAGKRVLVTGGTRGIGRAVVTAFAQAGARLVVCHRCADDAAKSLAAQLAATGEHLLVRADVTDASAVDELAGAARDHLGGLDVLVNNVGMDAMAPLAELSETDWHTVLNRNVTSAYLTTRAVLGLLGDGASVVNIGSSAALRGRPNGAHYTASKAALHGLTRALCKELGPSGIRVNLVAPGVVDPGDGSGPPPPVVQRLIGMTALGRLGCPDDVAATVLFLAGDGARYISGSTINVDGGI